MHRSNSIWGKRALSLSQRLILAITVPLVLILAVSSYFDYRLARYTTNLAHDQALADNLLDLEAHIRSYDGVSVDLSDEVEAMLRSDAPDEIFFAILDQHGRVISGDTDLLAAMQGESAHAIQFADSVFRGKAIRLASHRFEVREKIFGILIAETTAKRHQSGSRILMAMILPNCAVMLATILAVVLGVRKGLLPLAQIEADIASRSAADLHEINTTCAPVEVQPLLGRLNELFALLRQSSAIQQRFIADAAHQLRTPLGGLQTQLDLASMEGAFTNYPERQELIEEACSRISHLLSQLLSYARTESSTALREQFSHISLAALVEMSASTFVDAALSKGLDLGYELAEAPTMGIRWMLSELLSNLIDNAIRYSPVGGMITVRCGENGGRAFIEVEDNGPGIPEASRKKVLERFYRLPGSSGNGCGLGLAIVQEISELHGANLILKDGISGGAMRQS